MQLSETVKLYPDRFQKELIESAMQEYVACVNRIVSDAVSGISIAKLSSAGVDAALPSALKNQCIRDAKSIMKKHYKACHSAVMKNRRLAKKGMLLKGIHKGVLKTEENRLKNKKNSLKKKKTKKK